jgi:hypothetical protein
MWSSKQPVPGRASHELSTDVSTSRLDGALETTSRVTSAWQVPIINIDSYYYHIMILMMIHKHYFKKPLLYRGKL